MHYEEAFGQNDLTCTKSTPISCEEELENYLKESNIDPKNADKVGLVIVYSYHSKVELLKVLLRAIDTDTDIIY